MFQLLLVLLSITPSIYGRTCKTVNGVEGACHLKLNQFTLAGSHNSGAGAFGSMWHWSGIQASGCWYPNQDQSISDQLDLGIRYFDFDVAYIQPYESSGSFWEAGIVLVHGKAYSRSLRRALEEIEQFMGSHPDSLVVVRITNDYAQWARSNVRKNLPKELDFLIRSYNVRMNEDRNPLLSNAMKTNKRLIIFVSSDLLSSPRYLHNLAQIQNAQDGYALSYCLDPNIIENTILNDRRSGIGYFAIQINWYNTRGLCNYELAGLCDGPELNKLEAINKKIVDKTRRPINLVLIDYVGRGAIRLSGVVKRINEYNVKVFKNIT